MHKIHCNWFKTAIIALMWDAISDVKHMILQYIYQNHLIVLLPTYIHYQETLELDKNTTIYNIIMLVNTTHTEQQQHLNAHIWNRLNSFIIITICSGVSTQMCRMENIFATKKVYRDSFSQIHLSVTTSISSFCLLVSMCASGLNYCLYCIICLSFYLLCVLFAAVYTGKRALFFCDACRTWNTHESRVTSNDCRYMQLYNNNDDYNCCLLFFWKEFIFFHIPISGITCTKFPLF